MRYKYIILGAGCAGLSLCWYLLEEGVRDSILILDHKTSFEDDRTWCFWDTEPTPFTHLATHRWPAWTIRRPGDATVRASAPETPYVRLRGGDFYQAVLARIAAWDNVTLRLGVPVIDGYTDEGVGGVCVSTAAGTFRSEILFDALALGSPRFPVARTGEVTFSQQFFGQFVRTNSDVFDPETVTLMDFTEAKSAKKSADALIRFVYLLPLSPCEALVENTVLVPGGSRAKDALAQAGDAAGNRREIAAYLESRYGTRTFHVASEEQGLIPMTTRAFPLRTGNRVYSIGLAGGAARPSSGYAFMRIQQRCRSLARTVGYDSRKYEKHSCRTHSARQAAATTLLDRIFLQAMQQNPGAVPGYFQRMFACTSPGAVVRLLSDSASLFDCLAVIKTLPPGDFVRAALRLFHPQTDR